MKIIPFNPSVSSRQSFNCNLGTLVCKFSFHWNERAGSWYCDFETTSGRNLGVRLVEDRSLLGSTNAIGLFGDFRVLMANKTGSRTITYDNFGSDWKLVYADYSEWKVYDGV